MCYWHAHTMTTHLTYPPLCSLRCLIWWITYTGSVHGYLSWMWYCLAPCWLSCGSTMRTSMMGGRECIPTPALPPMLPAWSCGMWCRPLHSSISPTAWSATLCSWAALWQWHTAGISGKLSTMGTSISLWILPPYGWSICTRVGRCAGKRWWSRSSWTHQRLIVQVCLLCRGWAKNPPSRNDILCDTMLDIYHIFVFSFIYGYFSFIFLYVLACFILDELFIPTFNTLCT